jgi:penicillin-binding protein 1B
MLNKTSWWMIRVIATACFVLAGISSCLVYQERGTLSRLGHPGENSRATEIYSGWLDLTPQNPVSWERVLGWLSSLDYHPVTGTPHQPGEYFAHEPEITLFARPFRYPDKDYPAELLRLAFRDRRLAELEALSGHAALSDWRLEPKVFAAWSTTGKTAHQEVRIFDLPPYVPRSVMAIEDKRFFQHGAFDFVGILRATWVDLRYGHLRQGASTISQQLARSIFLDVRRTWHRKVLEAALAVYLELRYTKPQLLEMYLNQVYWGQEGSESLLGIESASESLFGKSARFLTVGESAILAGMLQSPNRFSPRGSPVVARARRKMVLNLMRNQGLISEVQYRAALRETIHLTPTRKSNEAAYFLAALHDQLSERYEIPVMLSQGWRIFTTLDPLLQHEAAKVMAGRPSAGEAPQGALIAIDPATGGVRAWVGGTNYQTNPFDHAVNARRQPGSAFKPFVVLTALESRKVTTATILEDKPLTLKGSSGTWTPQNYDRRYRGKASVWDSLVLSLNVPVVRLAVQTGIVPIAEVAHRAGIASALRSDMSLALGTSEVSLLELCGAYSTLAASGVRRDPYNLEAVIGPDGNILESHGVAMQAAFAPEVTYLVTQMLEAVLDAGTARAARQMSFAAPAAGKTGTSENFQDDWFMGYTTNLVCGVWVGYDLPRSLGRSAAGVALPLWTAFMKKAVILDPPRAFEAPASLVWKTIDTDSGLLARSGCPHRRKAAFLAGTEPTSLCPLHSGGLMGFFKRWSAKT